MMRPKSLILLALALGCGLIASIGISQVLENNKGQPTPVESVPIYVALQNINLGDPVNDGMVALQEWPKDKVPPGAITRWEDVEDRRPRTTIFAGEPLLDGKFLLRGQSQDPISSIPAGMRLKTLSVDATKSAAGLLSPGDRVDVQIFVRRNDRAGIAYPFTKIILQNIRVFAVDQDVQRSSDGTEARAVAKTVSVIVTPEQANLLTTAANLGEISLIPRNPDDETLVDDAEQTTDFLFGRSQGNSREKEQGSAETGEGLPGLLSKELDRSSLAEVDPPFKMKLIFPNEVTELEFSSETGEPLYSTERDRRNFHGTGAAAVEDAAQALPEPMDEPREPELELPEDFPIDLNRK